MVHASTPTASTDQSPRPSYTGSTRCNRVPLGRYRLGRVVFAVVLLATLWTNPCPLPKAEALQNVPASFVATLLAAREKAVNRLQSPPIPLALVFEHRTELPKRRIADGLGQTPVLDHAPDIQVLDGNGIIPPNQAGRRLVQGILAAPADPLVNPGNPDSLGVPTSAPLHPPGQSPLRPSQPALVFGRQLGIGDPLPIAGRGKTTHAQIHSHHGSRGGQGREHLVQNQRHKILAARLTGNRDGARLRSKAPAPLHSEPTQTRNHKVRVLGIGLPQPEAKPGVSSRLPMAALLELRIPSLLAEKLPISSIKMPEGLLEGNTRNLGEPFGLGVSFPLRQLGRTADKANLFATLGPRLLAPRQRTVIHIPATPENPSQSNLLTLGRIKTITITNLHRETVSPKTIPIASLSPRQAIEGCATEIC